MLKNLKSKLLLLLSITVLVGASFSAGFYIFHKKLKPYRLYNSVVKHLTDRNLNSSVTVPTIFVNLKIDKKVAHAVPTTRRGSGGGLASFGNDLLVLNHEGDIFEVLEDSVRKSTIETPSNNFDLYQAAAKSEEYKDLYHRFNYFRYNDILSFQTENAKHLAISYTEWLDEQDCYGTAVAVLDIPLAVDSISEVNAAAEDWNVVFRTKPCLPLKTESAAIEGHMAGGRLDHLGDGKIILGSGDYAWDGLYAPDVLAQTTDNDYGKVIEIDTAKGESSIVSYGHRNLQGVVVAKDSMEIWTVEHGPRGGDELNKIIDNANYGWPLETLGTRYNKLPWPNIESYGRHDNYTQPILAWVPSIATSSLIQIRDFHPSWDGDLLVGTFKGGMTYRIRVNNDKVVFAEPVKLIEGRIRDLHQHTDGRIAVWSDGETISFVSVGDTLISETIIDDFLAVENYSKQQSTDIKKALDACLECHALDPFDHESAPGLGAIYTADIASSEFENYSQALRNVSGKWDEDNLVDYLSDPQAFAPGSYMPDPQIAEESTIRAIVKLLMQSGTAY